MYFGINRRSYTKRNNHVSKTLHIIVYIGKRSNDHKTQLAIQESRSDCLRIIIKLLGSTWKERGSIFAMEIEIVSICKLHWNVLSMEIAIIYIALYVFCIMCNICVDFGNIAKYLIWNFISVKKVIIILYNFIQ